VPGGGIGRPEDGECARVTGTLGPVDELVTVGRYLYRGDAEVAAARLADAGLRSMIVADDEGGLSPGFFSDHRIRLVVDAATEAQAATILDGGREPPGADEITAAMVAHARFTHPEEACGLLATDSTRAIRMVYCLTNVDRSAHRFTVDPAEHFMAMRHAERNGWEIGGAFHSHPSSSAYPSSTDVARALDPEWLYVVVSLVDLDAPVVAWFRIRDGRVTPVGTAGQPDGRQ